MDKIKYSISEDFSRKPGLRTRDQSDNSGQEFLEDVLLPLFEKAIKEKKIIEINLDNTFGYGPSFLEESFGGLARLKKTKNILQHLSFVSIEEPYLVNEIEEYISDAKSS